MKGDTIYRQDAIEALSTPHGILYPIRTIESLPAAQPERKPGKWIYKNDLKQFFCSECGYPSLTYDDTYIYGMDLPNYCEDCGADMRGEQDDPTRD